eukprot:7380786-Prymnesium_polylepis.1
MKRYGWGYLELVITAIPLLPTTAAAVGTLLCWLCGRRTAASLGARHPHAHIMVAAVTFGAAGRGGHRARPAAARPANFPLGRSRRRALR